VILFAEERFRVGGDAELGGYLGDGVAAFAVVAGLVPAHGGGTDSAQPRGAIASALEVGEGFVEAEAFPTRMAEVALGDC